MTPLFLTTLFFLGLIGGFFSGLLGIGGGIIMVPLLLYIPSLMGIGVISMKTAAGITMVQSLAGSFSGLLVHKKNKFIHRSLVAYMGIASIVGSLIGSISSKYLNGEIMLQLFAGMALIATMMMLIPSTKNDEFTIEDVNFNKTVAFIIALVVGILGGIVGQGGAFILIPMMLYIIKIPTRVALGSSVAISFLSGVAGFIGKWGTGQIPFVMAFVLVVGAVIGAQVGGRLSKHLPTRRLRVILSILIVGTAIKMCFQLNQNIGYLITVGLLFFISFIVIKKSTKKPSSDISN